MAETSQVPPQLIRAWNIYLRAKLQKKTKIDDNVIPLYVETFCQTCHQKLLVSDASYGAKKDEIMKLNHTIQQLKTSIKQITNFLQRKQTNKELLPNFPLYQYVLVPDEKIYRQEPLDEIFETSPQWYQHLENLVNLQDDLKQRQKNLEEQILLLSHLISEKLKSWSPTFEQIGKTILNQQLNELTPSDVTADPNQPIQPKKSNNRSPKQQIVPIDRSWSKRLRNFWIRLLLSYFRFK